jgi:hypothetical protein
MPRDRTDVVRRSLFVAGTLTPGAGEPEAGEERRLKAKPKQNRASTNRASTAAGQSQNRSPHREAARARSVASPRPPSS